MEAIVILGISILLQLSAAYLALSLLKVIGRQRAWIAIAAAILLMAVRRSITFARLVTDM